MEHTTQIQIDLLRDMWLLAVYERAREEHLGRDASVLRRLESNLGAALPAELGTTA